MDGLSGAEIQVHKAYEAWIDSLKAQLAAKDALIEKLVGALTMAREELVFGGDWETARSVVGKALALAAPKEGR